MFDIISPVSLLTPFVVGEGSSIPPELLPAIRGEIDPEEAAEAGRPGFDPDYTTVEES